MHSLEWCSIYYCYNRHRLCVDTMYLFQTRRYTCCSYIIPNVSTSAILVLKLNISTSRTNFLLLILFGFIIERRGRPRPVYYLYILGASYSRNLTVCAIRCQNRWLYGLLTLIWVHTCQLSQGDFLSPHDILPWTHVSLYHHMVYCPQHGLQCVIGQLWKFYTLDRVSESRLCF